MVPIGAEYPNQVAPRVPLRNASQFTRSQPIVGFGHERDVYFGDPRANRDTQTSDSVGPDGEFDSNRVAFDTIVLMSATGTSVAASLSVSLIPNESDCHC